MTLEGYIRRNLEYNKVTGQLLWLTDRSGKRKAGHEAGFIKTFHRGKKYRYVTVQGQKLLAHRVAYFLVQGVWPDNIDHDDGDGTNNVWSNLKNTDCSGNHKNMRMYNNNTSGESGVVLTKCGTFQVQVRYGGKNNYLGTFKTMDEARRVRDQAFTDYNYSANHGKKAEHKERQNG
jgi:hypothetical protein